MNKLSIIFVASASLMAAHGAVAEYVTKKPIYATISPPYRTADMHNYDGEEMVRVTQITATNESGQRVVIFHERAGAILPRSELENVSMLVNPGLFDQEGDYQNLVVNLAEEVVSLRNGQIQSTRMQPGMGTTTLSMKGSIHIGKFVVTSTGLKL